MSLLTETVSTVTSTNFLVTSAVPVEPTFAPVYGKAANMNEQTTVPGSLIAWGFGTSNPTSGFADSPGYGETTFTIASSGVYQYTLSIVGRCDPFIGVGVSVNNTVVSINTFGSPVSNGLNIVLCVGSGLLSLRESDVVGVKNVSDSVLNHTEQFVSGNALTMNANFTLQRIA